VAVDSNRLPFGTYQAVVQHASGTGGYSVELAQGTSVMDPHTQTYSEMPTGAAVQVKDVWLNQGQCMGMEVTNFAHNNGFMALMASDPANPATWVQDRIQSVADVSFNTDNILVFTKQFKYTAIRSAWYGVVVVDNNDNTPGPYLAKYRPIAC
jgi:hypothetical protein